MLITSPAGFQSSIVKPQHEDFCHQRRMWLLNCILIGSQTVNHNSLADGHSPYKPSFWNLELKATSTFLYSNRKRNLSHNEVKGETIRGQFSVLFSWTTVNQEKHGIEIEGKHHTWATPITGWLLFNYEHYGWAFTCRFCLRWTFSSGLLLV